MRLYKGKVIANSDPLSEGRLTVAQIGGEEQIVFVTYTTPYFHQHAGGFFAVPPLGSFILFVYDSELNENFYLSTIVSPKAFSLGSFFNKILRKVLPEKYLYTPKGTPRAITLKDSKGAGLKISNYFVEPEDGNDQEAIVPLTNQVTLKSTQGHKLLLSDTPTMDCVLLKNKDDDYIKLTANSNDVDAANSLKVNTKSSQKYFADSGEIFFNLKDGKDIWLVNNSTGVNTGSDKYKSKNVNLVSTNGNINVYTEVSGNGSILLRTHNNGIVQINADGGVSIFTDGEVKIKSSQNISIASDSDISLNSGGSITLSAQNNINLYGQGSLNAAGTGGSNVGISNTLLNLNSLGSAPAPNLDVGSPIQHPYEE